MNTSIVWMRFLTLKSALFRTGSRIARRCRSHRCCLRPWSVWPTDRPSVRPSGDCVPGPRVASLSPVCVSVRPETASPATYMQPSRLRELTICPRVASLSLASLVRLTDRPSGDCVPGYAHAAFQAAIGCVKYAANIQK